MRRSAFLATLSAAMFPLRVRCQSDSDPAMASASPALRVLLGPGEVTPAQSGFLFNGQLYRGTFARLDDGSIVDVIGIEEYLYSVVGREMSARWPPAALEAQAISARTYVLQRSNPRRSYDLVPSEIDQVYQGVSGETPAARAAVNASMAQVLRFGNEYATVAYSSCCGGHTEASADAWGGTPLPYLAGVACGYCTDSPNYHWSASLQLQDVAARFSAQVAQAGDLRNVRVAGIDASGRARAFELVGDRGRTVVRGSAFRVAVGARLLRSLLITHLQLDNAEAIALEGAGLGHGVGMCQWGARGLALTGRTAREILALYFPGTSVDG